MACMLLSLWLQLPMWLVVFGARSVAPGGGEYMVALFLGLPALLLAFVLLGIAVAKAAWRSSLSCAGFAASLLPLAGWIVLLFRDLSR
jgi:Na+-driven multidrug efflux pump